MVSCQNCLRDKFLLPIYTYNKIQGMPISKSELEHAVLEILDKS